MATDRDASDFEPPHASSPTAHIVSQLELHGYQPSSDEPDPRPAPENSRIEMAVDEVFEVIGATLADTRSEPDMADLLWGVTNVFHRAADRVQRLLDDNEDAQKRSQREQDGSEVKSVELERLLGQGQVLIDRRDSLEALRDHAAEAYGRQCLAAPLWIAGQPADALMSVFKSLPMRIRPALQVVLTDGCAGEEARL